MLPLREAQEAGEKQKMLPLQAKRKQGEQRKLNKK
jgi:hypothetical protein